MIVFVVNFNNFVINSHNDCFTLLVVMCGTYPSRLRIDLTFKTECVTTDAKKGISSSR